jgi:hypothetical protein
MSVAQANQQMRAARRRDLEKTVLDEKDGGKYEVVSERLYESGQSWNYKLIVAVHTFEIAHKLRVSIRRNAYDEQCHCKVSRWDGDKWHYVTGMPIAEARCEPIVYVLKRSEFDIGVFRIDARTLLEEAKAVVL